MAPTGFKYYYYTPSIAAAVIAMLIWTVALFVHLWQLVLTRTKFWIPFMIGVFMEFIGYCARISSARQAPDYRLMAYVVQSTFVLLAPTLMAASIYMELSRVIRVTNGEAHAIISSSKITKIFLTGDVICLLAQSGGGGLSAAGQSIGTKIVIVGLVIQISVFFTFVVTAAAFNLRIDRVPTPRSIDVTIDWRRHMKAIYISSGLIFLRSAVRLAEYVEGFSGYIYTHEWCLYLLDFVPMIAVVILFVLIHPSEVRAWLEGGKGMRAFTVRTYDSGDPNPLQRI